MDQKRIVHVIETTIWRRCPNFDDQEQNQVGIQSNELPQAFLIDDNTEFQRQSQSKQPGTIKVGGVGRNFKFFRGFRLRKKTIAKRQTEEI